MIGRFARFLQHDDRRKEAFLDAVAGGASELEEIERLEGLRGDPVTLGTVRKWARTDREFAEALRVARTGSFGEPHVWVDDVSGDPNEVPPWSVASTQLAQRGPLDDNSGLHGPMFGGFK